MELSDIYILLLVAVVAAVLWFTRKSPFAANYEREIAREIKRKQEAPDPTAGKDND